MSAIWLKSEVAGSESSMNEREITDCGCVACNDAVTGAISFALVAVMMMSEPSAISPLACVPSVFCPSSGAVAGDGVVSAGRTSARAIPAPEDRAKANTLARSHSARDEIFFVMK